MPAPRPAIVTAFAFIAFSFPVSAQNEKTLTLGNENRSFAISSGSTFSATGKTAERKSRNSASSSVKIISSDLEEILEFVKNNHVSGRSLETEKLVGSAITTMLQQLDPHSSYYTSEEFRELNDDHQGRYFGIGTLVADFEESGVSGTFVISTTKNAPAERAGLRFGDRIVKVNGQDVAGMNAFEISSLIRGPQGTSVRIAVEHSNGLTDNVTIRRSRLDQSSVGAALSLENGVGYIALTEGFGYTTATEFESAFLTLKQKGIRTLTIDLRGNGGGLMDQAIMIAEKFLPAGRTIVSQRGRNASEARVWRSKNLRPESMPLVLLVDEASASASEILAGAMQDNDRATIIGTRTYGKGLVQNIIPLADGAGLALTSERYYAPSGRSIQREYSDAGLYNYFQHTNRGSLIDKPAVATRTRNGRVVYGGNGIEPDVTVGRFDMSKERAATVDRLFFFLRKQNLQDAELFKKFCAGELLSCEKDGVFLHWQLAMFRKYFSAGDAESTVSVLDLDPQFAAAKRVLINR